jgi:protein-serine/threonine kinase
MASQSSSSAGKPADYVYFERTTAGFSEDALPRSKGAQLKLEHYYKVAVEAAIERNQRCVIFGAPDPLLHMFIRVFLDLLCGC